MPRTTKRVVKKPTPVVNDEFTEFDSFITKKQSGGSKGWLAITLVVIIVALVGALLFMNKNEGLEKELSYKSVVLDTGQVYYAKVVKEDALNFYLDDVYYIQTEQKTIPSEDEEPQVITVPVLIHRGDELHKPQGLLQINRSKVVLIEEIGEDSEIIQEINRLQNL